MTSSIPEFILRVQYPILSENPPGDSTDISLLEPCNKNRWQVTLTRVYDLLKIDVRGLELNGMNIDSEYMHIIPMNGSKPIIAKVCPQTLRLYNTVSVLVRTEIVQKGDRYEFYIVQAKEKEIPWFFHASDGIKSPPLPAYEEERPSAITNDTASALLCDIYSVDTQIVFGLSRTTDETCIWAHRTILSKYHTFDILLKQLSFDNRSALTGPIKLVVTKVSFATFATLLRFIYTGEIHRTSHPEYFAISKFLKGNNYFVAGGIKDLHQWHFMDLHRPLSEPVTWQELLDAANIYKMDALRAQCEAALKSIAKVSMARSTDAT
ncbi:MAG: hypothetical protein BYD32DRAFT_406279 [Podila humilis]|nr:MAG: hypothetical protein BYD32DRAFT_406279 [Podila humilis]